VIQSEVKRHFYLVPSTKIQGQFRLVIEMVKSGFWKCDCASFKFRNPERLPCCHILLVQQGKIKEVTIDEVNEYLENNR